MVLAKHMHTGLPFEWQIISPNQKLLRDSNFLNKIAHFRTKIFSQDRKRKGFSKLDTDEILDINSYHIVVSINKGIVGYNRITPLHIDMDCIFSRAYGKEYFQTVYRQLATKNPLAEVSRWSVDPQYSPHFLGIKIFAGFWALIIKLEHNVISINNSKKANYCIQQGGAKLMTNDPIYSDYYNDILVPLYYQYQKPPDNLLSLIKQMNIELNIDALGS